MRSILPVIVTELIRHTGMVGVASVLSICAMGGQQYQPPPSNRESGVAIDQYIGSWKNSELIETHGTLIERAILRPGNPYNPGPPGAVMEFHRDFSLGALAAGGRTQPCQHAEEEVLYIESGKGRIESGGYFWPLEPGYGVLIPPHTEHVLVSEAEESMNLLVLTDLLEPGTSTGNDILVRNSAQLPYAEESAHWNYYAKMLFGPKDGTSRFSNILIVDLFPMTIGAPHAHDPHWEEVWCKLPPKSSYLLLGSELREQHPNEAFLVPPNGMTVHSVVNLSGSPMSWFYFCHCTVEVRRPDWVYKVPSVSPQKFR